MYHEFHYKLQKSTLLPSLCGWLQEQNRPNQIDK